MDSSLLPKITKMGHTEDVMVKLDSHNLCVLGLALCESESAVPGDKT